MEMNFGIELSFSLWEFMVIWFTRTQIWSYQDILWRSAINPITYHSPSHLSWVWHQYPSPNYFFIKLNIKTILPPIISHHRVSWWGCGKIAKRVRMWEKKKRMCEQKKKWLLKREKIIHKIKKEIFYIFFY